MTAQQADMNMERTLPMPEALDVFPPAARTVARMLDLTLYADDGMYVAGGDLHYLSCGASGLNAILSALQLALCPRPGAILDFGSGAGRVTRWLRAAFPAAEIGCCDLRSADLDFCRERFGAHTWVSGVDIRALAAPRRYDLIWLGSVLTHLSADKSRELLGKMLSWTNAGGLVVASTSGRTAKAKQEREGPFIHAEGWPGIARQFAATGYGYSDYLDVDGYGLSMTKPSWSARLVETTAGARLVLLAEQAWDGLHDILAVQNDGSYAALSPAEAPDARHAEIAALKARVAALEGSTSWRITSPLRRIAGLWRGPATSG